MALSFAPAALVRPEGIEIAHPQVVSKSYPHYWEDLKAAGFSIRNQPFNFQFSILNFQLNYVVHCHKSYRSGCRSRYRRVFPE